MSGAATTRGAAHATCEAFEGLVRFTIADELPAAAEFLADAERAEFTHYYARLPAPDDALAIRRYVRGLWRSEAGWVARWLGRFAAERGRAPRVLDAGSGFGTYSMLFAAVGADVTGVDLRPDRLAVAGHRLGHHHACTGRTLQVRYGRADLTQPWPGRYDLVWVYNALSHIDPLDGFLTEVRRGLEPGGVLVVGDINGAHAGHRRRLAGLRDQVHQEYVAPDGRRHAYAVERTFPPAELRALVTAAGLRIVHHELFWFGLSRLPEPFYEGVLGPLQRRWALGQRFARRQLLAATPGGAGR